MNSLRKLANLATKFEIKLAEVDDQAVLQAFNKFFSDAAQTWFLSNNISGASEKHNAFHSLGETHYDWVVTVTLPDASKKNIVEVGSGSMPGFADFLKSRYAEVSKDQKSGLVGTTATFQVSVK